ncbi:MAG TPA: dihydroorotate dehydrogenase-like protein [Mycobacteriales bacterium]
MDLTTDYLGLRLRNPLVASASPLSQTVEGIRRLADAGIGAVVLYSQFEEQLGDESAAVSTADPLQPQGAEHLSPGDYLTLLERARAAVDVPVIGSLNGATAGGWVRYARAMQDAGASAVELNVYWIPGPGVQAGEVEQRHVDVLSAVKAAVSVPVAVKLSPFFIASGDVALQLDAAGADGLVLFNRFLQPDIDPDTLKLVPTLDLSSPVEARLARTWISLLRQRVGGSLAATTGVEDAADVAKYLLAGADVVMTASALLRHGVGHVGTLLAGLTEWMAWKGFDSTTSVRGALSVSADTDPATYAREGYVSVLEAAKFSHSRW